MFICPKCKNIMEIFFNNGIISIVEKNTEQLGGIIICGKCKNEFKYIYTEPVKINENQYTSTVLIFDDTLKVLQEADIELSDISLAELKEKFTITKTDDDITIE